MESKSVFTINEYGRINIRLRELMDSRHITRNYLAKVFNGFLHFGFGVWCRKALRVFILGYGSVTGCFLKGIANIQQLKSLNQKAQNALRA